MTDAELINQMRHDLACDLEPMTDKQIAEAIKEAVIQHGGTYVPIVPGSWGPHQTAVSILGISGMGDDAINAARDWVKNAMRTEDALQQGRAA